MAAERGDIEIGSRFMAIETMLTDMGATVRHMQEEAQTKEQATVLKLKALEDAHTTLTVQLDAFNNNLNAQKAELVGNIDEEFDKHKLVIQSIIDSARDQFDSTKRDLGALYGQSSEAFVGVHAAIDSIRAEIETTRNNAGGSSGGMKGFLATKQMIPDKFGKSEEAWRRWQDSVADYTDAICPGMRELLKLVEKSPDSVTDQGLDQWANGDPHKVKATKEGKNLYRLLKQLTEQEAQTVLLGVKAEDGFGAWRALHTRYGLSLAVKQAKATSDICGMINKPAKNPQQTRSLVSELERRVQVAEEIGGRAIDDDFKKSVLSNILDPATKVQAAPRMGTDSSYDTLKKFVLEFANNVTGISGAQDPDAMQIGRVSQPDDVKETYPEEPTGYWEAPSVDTELEHLEALSPNAQCYKCHGYGHSASQCPTPSPTKGKGGGKAGGKSQGPKGGKGWEPPSGKGGKPATFKGGKGGGASGPQFGNCFLCKGAHGHHFQKDCPLNRGKGGGGFNTFAESWPTPSQSQSIRMLSSLGSSTGAIKIHNRFEALRAEEAEKDHKELNKDEGDQEEETHYNDDFNGKLNCVGNFHIKYCDDARKVKGKTGKPHTNCGCTTKSTGSLSPLVTIEPETLCPVSKPAAEWEAIEMAVDSGASETVLPPDQLTSVVLEEGAAKKRGVSYEVANGDQIPNLGERRFQGVTDQGHVRGITAQVCEVNKPLLSVSKLVAQGNRVVFEAQGSYVQDTSTGERLWLAESGGMYSLKLWVRAPSSGF